MATQTRQRDMLELLMEDHREVEQLFGELEQATDTKRQQDLANIVIAELVRHAVAEEQYLYPTTREALPDGDLVADRELSDHNAVERTMKHLEGMEPTDAKFAPLLRTLMTEVREHVRDEEDNLFPRLRQACSIDDLRTLGRKVELAKKIAPTRPHPDAPDKPPWNQLVGAGTGLVDRIRDAVTGRPTSPEDL